MFKQGEIYLNWKPMEDYVHQMLDSILPQNLQNKKITSYIKRSSELNAYCLYDGSMIVNVGLIAEVKSEAALAVIMGHELGHYIKNHVVNDYVNKMKDRNKGNGANELELAIKRRGYSQQNELEADEQGYIIARNAGYDVSEALSNFEIFIREKEYYKKRYSSTLVNDDTITIKTKDNKLYTANTLEKLLSTHPDEKERKDKLSSFIKANTLPKKIKFKINATLFAALQKEARLESIGLLFSTHDYKECLERSFMFHLYDPDEITYQYYVAECIRRICLFDYTLKKKGFLTEKLTNDGFKDGEGILHDLKYLIPNQKKYSMIKSSELLDNSVYEFETYRDAFYYFCKKLLAKDNPEAYLMTALFENNKEKDKRKTSTSTLITQNPSERICYQLYEWNTNIKNN